MSLIIEPTIPGTVNGIVSLDPRVLQCQDCGAKDDADTVGLPETARKRPNLVHIRSSMRFHVGGWDGDPDNNPRLCRDCRLARGCTCGSCEYERGGR